MAKQMKVSELNEIPIIGVIYSFVNSYNYVTVCKVVRVTEYSVMVNRLMDDGKFSSKVFRMGAKDFSGFIKQN